MDALLYIGHGSRVKSAQEEAIAFIKKCMLRNPTSIQEYGFLELAVPTVEEAFSRCIERGATNIVVIPVLLLTAAHAKEDIPNELARLCTLHPSIKLAYANPIGVHPLMIDLVIERLHESKESLTENSAVLLVGRGSSDPEVKRDVTLLAQQVKLRLGVPRVEACYLVGASPSLEEGLQKARDSGYDKLFVIPYLLFNGILMKKIKRTIVSEEKSDEKKIVLCRYLGYHPLISAVLRERVEEALTNDSITFHQ